MVFKIVLIARFLKTQNTVSLNSKLWYLCFWDIGQFQRLFTMPKRKSQLYRQTSQTKQLEYAVWKSLLLKIISASRGIEEIFRKHALGNLAPSVHSVLPTKAGEHREHLALSEEEWLDKPHGVLTYRLTQVLTGHGLCVITRRTARRTRWSIPCRTPLLGRSNAVSSRR